MRENIKEELNKLLLTAKYYKEYLEDKKASHQLYQIYTKLNSIIFWIEAYNDLKLPYE